VRQVLSAGSGILIQKMRGCDALANRLKSRVTRGLISREAASHDSLGRSPGNAINKGRSAEARKRDRSRHLAFTLGAHLQCAMSLGVFLGLRPRLQRVAISLLGLRRCSFFAIVGQNAICRFDGVQVVPVRGSSVERISLGAGLPLIPRDLE